MSYSLPQLERLPYKSLVDLETRVAKAKKLAMMRERDEVRHELAAFAQKRGYSLSELVGSKHRSLPAKYRNPQDPKQTWTGQGRKPNWLVEKLDKGASLDQFKVA